MPYGMNRSRYANSQKSHNKNLSCYNLRLKLRTYGTIILFMLTINIPQPPHNNHQKNIIKNIGCNDRMRKPENLTIIFDSIGIKAFTGKRPSNMIETNTENNRRSIVFLKCQIKSTKIFLILKCRIMRVMSTT